MLAGAVRRRLEVLLIPFEATGRELDIVDAASVLDYCRVHRFSHVVNCAAYTRVDDAESDIEEAMAVNALGPEHLGRAADELGASIVHFSTDYVFDGNAREPYAEQAPCAPLGVYGKSKLEGERRLLRTASDGKRRTFVVRTSWLFASSGRNFVTTMLGLMRQRETLRVVADQHGRPTYTEDLAEAALALLGLSRSSNAPSGVYHFANHGTTSWHGFACEILRQGRLLGMPLITRDIEPIATAEFPRPAPRPAFSVLSSERIEQELGAKPRPWQQALSDCLRNLIDD
jgi:dTDP-4-dehydrorhamnose reductase